MAFLSSLTFTGTRVGGQRERQTQAFEASTAYFPRDFPSSTGYEAYATTRELEEKTRWTGKPAAKRPNFEKLGTRSPWRADWETVLGLPERSSATPPETNLIPTQREDPIVAGVDGIGMWLLRGCEASEILSNMSKLFNPGAGLLQEINRLRMKRGNDPLGTHIKANELINTALVSVRINMCRRGAPADLAMIYSVQDEEMRKWTKVLQKTQIPGGDFDFTTDEEAEVSSTLHIVSNLTIVARISCRQSFPRILL